VVVEDRKTGSLRPTKEKLAAAMKQPMRRFGYLASPENYGTDPMSGYLADRQTGQLVLPPDNNSWGVYGGPP